MGRKGHDSPRRNVFVFLRGSACNSRAIHSDVVNKARSTCNAAFSSLPYRTYNSPNAKGVAGSRARTRDLRKRSRGDSSTGLPTKIENLNNPSDGGSHIARTVRPPRSRIRTESLRLERRTLRVLLILALSRIARFSVNVSANRRYL